MAHVVIADADYGVLYLLAMLVGRLGWTCNLADNGLEAWEKVYQQAPDLVVAEVDLPGMNGLELLRATKSHPSLARTRVVLMGLPRHEAMARAAACAAYLTKPFGGQAVLTLLPQLLPHQSSD